MIYNYKRGNKPAIGDYAKNIKFLDKQVEFKNGLNIIVGPNGSGKTTLLVSLAKLFFAEQQGYTKINGLSDIGSLFHVFSKDIDFSDNIEHNGIPILYSKLFDTGYFDDDNFSDSMESIYLQKNNSQGEVQNSVWDKVINNIGRLKKVEEIKNEFKNGVNDYYQEITDVWYEWFKKGIVKSEKVITILLDEPTSNMDIINRFEFWEKLYYINYSTYQIIIATHDITPFIINNLKYNIIETEKGYYNKIQEYTKKGHTNE